MDKKMDPANDLGNLILRLNPYTNKDIPYSEPKLTAGEMNPYFGNPASNGDGCSLMEVEADGPYRQEWTFKGEPQKVGMAYRIKYRFPIKKGDTVQYWLEDYLLIGFEGSMG
ncbi:MAG: hypothetical protein JO007_03860 [Alphaproteobacteria bacterium]|nr:hypothetical protein [Alphaproteobacteria bacterium]